MSAYVVIDLDIADADGFQQYVDGVTPMIERAGGRNLVVDPHVRVLEGEWRPSTLVVHEFPSREVVQQFWDSPEYAPFKELRRRYSTVKVVVGEASQV
jgi:uncharacterized protein (DUF1330 family)